MNPVLLSRENAPIFHVIQCGGQVCAGLNWAWGTIDQMFCLQEKMWAIRETTSSHLVEFHWLKSSVSPMLAPRWAQGPEMWKVPNCPSSWGCQRLPHVALQLQFSPSAKSTRKLRSPSSLPLLSPSPRLPSPAKRSPGFLCLFSRLCCIYLFCSSFHWPSARQDRN